MAKINNAAEKLNPVATGLLIVVVTVAVGAVMLAQFETTSYSEETVSNETFNATSSPYVYQVTNSTDSDFVEITSAQAYQSTSQSTTVTTSVINDSYVNISGVTLDTGDESLEYTFNTESTATGVVGQGLDALSVFGDFLPVIVIVGIGAVILLMMKVFGSSKGRRTTT